jgi:hypothetical protein
MALILLVPFVFWLGERIGDHIVVFRLRDWLISHIPQWAALLNVIVAIVCPLAIPFLSEESRKSWAVAAILTISVLLIQPCFMLLPESLSLKLLVIFIFSALLSLIAAAIRSFRKARTRLSGPERI